MGFDIWCMGIGEANGLHRPPAQGFAATFGHHLNREAAVKVGRVLLPVLEFGLFCRNQRVDKAVILRLVHWAIQVGRAVFLSFALVIA